MTDWWSPLRGVLPSKYVKNLADSRDIHTVGDLLRYRPRRFLDNDGDLTDLHMGAFVVFVGTVEVASTRLAAPRPGQRRKTIFTVTVTSGGHEIDITFFTPYPHVRELREGRRGLFAGKVGRYRDRWQLAHPAYEFLPDTDGDTGSDPDSGTDAGTEDAAPPLQGVSGMGELLNRARIPVYKQVKGIPSWHISRAVETVLAAADLPDPLPADLVQWRELMPFATAWHDLHLPPSDTAFFAALRRLKYDEALAMQITLARRRAAQTGAPAVPRTPRAGGLAEAFDERLPFALTDGQRRVGEEITADLGRSTPMNRLLQGDVGSGKTVVALRAMLAVIDAGGQAALLAPTEVLAQQHHRSLQALLGPLAEGGMLGGADHGTRVALLTGSDSAAMRKRALLQAASGEAGIVVGTHALLQDTVQFADLGLVVVDEQHRFGVEQRDALRVKADHTPHMLVMTATPIPRTVAMTVFGDMETSVLDELPAGRAPIQTNVVDNPRWYERAWHRVAEEVAAGRQVYVVCPRIGEDGDVGGVEFDGFEAAVDSRALTDVLTHAGTHAPTDDMDGAGLFAELADESDPAEDETGPPRSSMRGVLETVTELQGNPALAGARIGLLHGRLPSDEKDRVMSAFAAGAIDVLVATTVIEVGVDVPGATVMVVMDADRFGVSQLHQLRGRVGRGEHPGLCLLVTFGPTELGRARLDALASSTDGFELSRLDLASRREGDILGTRQSGGGSQLQFLRLSGREDERIIAEAREDAARVIAEDPELRGFTDLARILDDHLADGSVDYLEKG